MPQGFTHPVQDIFLEDVLEEMSYDVPAGSGGGGWGGGGRGRMDRAERAKKREQAANVSGSRSFFWRHRFCLEGWGGVSGLPYVYIVLSGLESRVQGRGRVWGWANRQVPCAGLRLGFSVYGFGRRGSG